MSCTWKTSLTTLMLLGLVTVFTGCSDERTVAEYERSFDASDIEELLLEHDAGDVVITGEPGRETITVEARLRTHRSQGNDAEAMDSVIIELAEPTSESGELIVGLSAAPRGYYLEVEVFVPERLAMTVKDGSGDLEVRDVAYLTLDDGAGDAVVENIGYAAVIVDGSGDLIVRNIGGSLQVSDGSGDLLIEEVGGTLFVDDSAGDLLIEHCGASASVEDGSGDLVVRDVADQLTIRDGSGDIVVRGAGAVSIPQPGSGDVSIH